MEGRYFLGVAPGGHHTDAILHGYENISSLPPRQLEALHLMERVWERKPFVEKGEFFQAGFPGSETMPEYDVLIADNSPYGGRDKLRSEERRVGKEWVRKCRYRWAPCH